MMSQRTTIRWLEEEFSLTIWLKNMLLLLLFYIFPGTIQFIHISVESASVVSGSLLDIQGSRFQIRLRSMDFFQDVKILSTSPPGCTLSWGSRVWDFRLAKEPQVWKKGLWGKFNRNIHVLIISKFRGDLKRSQWPPHQNK